MESSTNEGTESEHEVRLFFRGTFSVMHSGPQTEEEAIKDTLKEFQEAKARFENEYGNVQLISMMVNNSPREIPQGVV